MPRLTLSRRSAISARACMGLKSSYTRSHRPACCWYVFSPQFSRLWQHSLNFLHPPAVAFYHADYNGTPKTKPVSFSEPQLTVLSPRARESRPSFLFPETALRATDVSKACLPQVACTKSLSVDTLRPGRLLVNSRSADICPSPPQSTAPSYALILSPTMATPPAAHTIAYWATWHSRAVRPWTRTASTP